jgi:hypothetical protein
MLQPSVPTGSTKSDFKEDLQYSNTNEHLSALLCCPDSQRFITVTDVSATDKRQ